MAEKNWTVVQVPYGGGYSSLNLAHTPNTRRAPKALQKEFMRQRVFMADNGVSFWDNVTWGEVSLGFGRQNNIHGWERMNKSVLSKLKVLDWKDQNLLFLGGSHSITASTYIGAMAIFGWRQIGLVVLDAHPDCCYKANWPIHSDWLRWLVEGGYILPENILIIGLRQMEKSERDFLREYNIRYHLSNDSRNIDNFRFKNVSNMHFFEKLNSLKAIYLSIDIDVASAAYAPGTGCPSPGGLTDKELISLVKHFKDALPSLRAADIVEIDPLNWWRKRVLRYDATVDLGVKLIKEIIS